MDHRDLAAMAAATDTPVLNLLSDRDHPLQALADLVTVKQLLGRLEGARIAYVGDADNNVARSLAQACVLAGAELTLASPEAYQLSDAPYGIRHVVDPPKRWTAPRSSIPTSGCRWGQDEEADARRAAFAGYQVDEALMARAAPGAHFLPLPPGAPRRGGERRGDRRPAKRGLAPGGKSHAFGARRARLAGGRAMTDVRTRRLRTLADLLREGVYASQEDVTAELNRRGYPVTQATVSRDPRGDRRGQGEARRRAFLCARRADGGGRLSTGRLERILAEWALSIEAAGALIVIRTPPGSAHLVASAIDHAQLPEIAGTVSGDDTMFVAIRDGAAVQTMTARFRRMMGREKEMYA